MTVQADEAVPKPDPYLLLIKGAQGWGIER